MRGTWVRRGGALAAALLLVGCAGSGTGAGDDVPEGVPDDAEPARVVRVVDGDTVVLRPDGATLLSGETRVRLLEVDAPESVRPDHPVECWGRESSGELGELLPAGSRVWVQRDEELLDDYDRTLLYLWNEDEEFVNLELVRAGAAEAVLFEPNDRWIEALREAEDRARDAGRGLWGACRGSGR